MIQKKNLTPLILAGIFVLMLGLSYAAVPLYDLFCRVTGFGGTTQNAQNKELPKIVVNQKYKVRFDTNSNGALAWKFYLGSLALFFCSRGSFSLEFWAWDL